jgi:PTH2 family peptidyl-tRNA hydrolase
MSEHNMSIYTTLVAVSLSLGFWIGTRARNRTHLVNFKNEVGGVIVNDNSTRVIATDSYKMVLVVRTDLGMTSGKIAAQCSHAALACYKILQAKSPTLLRQWERTGQTKVALRCEHEEELLLLEAQAQSLNLCARSIQDAGKTQIAAGSRTVLGIIGPTRLINQVTGELRLL